MFGLSFGEILIILVVALLVLGPTGMPKLARTLGKGLRDFRRATGDLRGAFEQEFYSLDQAVEDAARIDPPQGAGAGASAAGMATQPIEGALPAAMAPADAILRAHQPPDGVASQPAANASPAGLAAQTAPGVSPAARAPPDGTAPRSPAPVAAAEATPAAAGSAPAAADAVAAAPDAGPRTADETR